MPMPNTFAAQMKLFFGILPGQTISDFMKELKALDANDRVYFTDLLNKADYPVIVKETP